jgi:predicted ATPase
VVRQASNDCAANKFGRWLPDCNHSADDFIGEQRKNATPTAQQAKTLELRAAMRMARLWRDQGKRDEARELLAPVCGWFTEGFDTRDLIEAKKLLDELSS